MGLPATAKQLAVDSNLLFDLAAKSDFAHTFREVFQELGYSLLVPPTVVQELSFMGFARKPQNAQQKVEQDLATIALKCLLSWKISPFNLVPTGHALTEQFVKKLQLASKVFQHSEPGPLSSLHNGPRGYNHFY